MQQRCRRSLGGLAPLFVAALVMWGGARSAQAQDFAPTDLSWLQDGSCADGVAVAALDAPSWLEDMADPAAPSSGDTACTGNAGCKTKGHYCAKAEGDCKGSGKCTAKPQVCNEIFKPVCGCNGKTYSNSCFAAMAGVNVKSEGACQKAGAAAATCKSNAQCKAAGTYCAKDTGKCEDDGVCAQKPQICPDIVAPVCGCNGKTYNNNCVAHRAGVNIKHDGKCEK